MFRHFLGRMTSKEYDFSRLIDCQLRPPFHNVHSPGVHVFCDIDKTYLETNFESLSSLVRIAYESALDKVTVSGAPDVLRTLIDESWSSEGENRFLHFVSSSPPQLRSVLAQKLYSDNLIWASDTFKNQAYNLYKGKLTLLRNHVAYKVGALLSHIHKLPTSSTFLFIGDNAELDAFVYLGVALCASGSMSQSDFCDYLKLANVDQKSAERICKEIWPKTTHQIGGIFIRRAPGYDKPLPIGVGHLVTEFKNFLELAFIFIKSQWIVSKEFPKDIAYRFHNEHGLSLAEVGDLLSRYDITFPDDSVFTDSLSEKKEVVQETSNFRSEKTEPRQGYSQYLDLSQFADMPIANLLDLARNWISKETKILSESEVNEESFN